MAGTARAARRARVLRPAAALTVVLAIAGCAGPTLSEDVYEGKAAASAESLKSDVESVRVIVETAGQDRAFVHFADVMVTDVESDLSGIDSAFMSRQPPTEASDALREQVATMLQEASDAIQDVRIALRRGDVAAARKAAEPLPRLSERLQAFAEAHR